MVKLNITAEDIEDSKGPDFSLLPTGWYNWEITDAEADEFKSEKNKGKPYYKVTLRAVDGDFAGRKQWVNVPLFTRWNNEKKTPTNVIPFFTSVTDGSGEQQYTEANDDGDQVLPSDFDIPEAGELIGQFVTGRVRVTENTYQGKTEDHNEVSSFRPYNPDDDPSPSKAEAAAAEAKPAAKGKKPAAKKGSLDL